MAWKSREDKMPPPSFFSMMVAYLQRAYPGAQISRELMLTLRPFLIEAWRNGRTAEAAAQTTCSCDGRQIIPSPVVAVHIAKGSVRPPKGAQRGEVFGADALRPPPRIERLQRQLDRVSREEQKRHAQVSRWEQRAKSARTDSTRQGAQREQAAATAKRADLLAEAQRMEAELQRLHRELNSPSMQQAQSAGLSRGSAPAAKAAAPSESQRVSQPVVTGPRVSQAQAAAQPHPEVQAQPTAQPHPKEQAHPAEQPHSAGRRRRGRPRSADARKPTSAPGGSVESQSAALFSAMQGLLPNMASQLVDAMAKEGGGK
jgi:hypothetical protein